MPHKRNPVTCEQISGLARVVRSNAQAAFENVALWHERDISHSSVERVILPDSTILVDYLLDQDDQPHRHDVRLSRAHAAQSGIARSGLVFSGQLLLDLVEAGMSREDAYRLVQAHAMRAWKEGLNFHDEILATRRSPRRCRRKQIENAFDLQRQLRNVDKIFARVFATKEDKAGPRKSSKKR